MAASVLAVALSACGSTNWGFPYRPDVQQGNWITSEQVTQLQKGMTREQVRFILGTPTLQDIFHSDRWDYPYYNKPGYGKEQDRKFTAWFEGDSLSRWEGDEQPDRQPFQKADTGASKDGTPQGSISSESAPQTPIESQNAPVNTVAPIGTVESPVQAESAEPQHRKPIINANEQRRSTLGVPTPGRSGAEPLR
ncbi:outer membrane protein assembly factor BamE [Candidimonas sp. SYP-B2681]|uniref:outer membrane protein assembly factor BamE n=1 Tax=Candidimonas sp. SYP-B2681 TaxID=2497686 RepID=UPI000F8868D3|nr:outer membrane protein assembly factor BamE [Candidimonas sp. SYP-B2681]